LIKRLSIAFLILLFFPPASYPLSDSLDVLTPDSLKTEEKGDTADSLSAKSSFGFLPPDRLKDELIEFFSWGDVLTSEHIDNSTGESIGDLLKMRSWADLAELASPGQPELCFVNGNPRGINILVDGHQFHQQDLHFPHRGAHDLNSVPLSNVSKIRFLPAGLANLWGNGSGLLGIDIITKDFDGKEPYSRMTANKGPYGFSRTQAELGRSLSSRSRFYLTAELEKSDGFLTNSDYDGVTLSGKTIFNLKKGTELRLSAYQYKTEMGLSLFPDANFQDLRKKMNNWGVVSTVSLKRNEDSFLNLSLSFGKQNQEVKSKAYDMESRKNQDYLALAANRTFWVGERHHIQIQGRIERRGFEALTTERTIYGGYLSIADMIEKSPRLRFLLFSRVGKKEGLEAQLSAGGGVSYDISENVRLFSSLGRFMEYPMPMDRFWPVLSLAFKDTVTDYIEEGDPEVKSQKSFVVDLGASLEKRNHRLSTYVFGSIIDDFIFWSNVDTTLHYGHFKPVNSEAKTWGTCVDLTSKFFGRLSSYISYSFKWSEDSKRKTRLPYTPQHSLFGYLQFEEELLRREIGLKLRLETNVFSERFMDEYEREKETGAALMNVKVTIRFMDFHFHYTVRNITNESCRLIGEHPIPERTYWWGFYWEFFD
jgi:outer membrane cobalamin receptor